LIKKIRDDIKKNPKGYNLLRGFSQNSFIPKYSFQTWPGARIQPCNLPKLNEHNFASHLPYTNHVNKFTMLFVGVLNLRTNSFEPGEHDTNRQITKAQQAVPKRVNHLKIQSLAPPSLEKKSSKEEAINPNI